HALLPWFRDQSRSKGGVASLVTRRWTGSVVVARNQSQPKGKPSRILLVVQGHDLGRPLRPGRAWRSECQPSSPLRAPVLSPNWSTLTPMRSSRLTHRLFRGVLRGYTRCRPGLIELPPLPSSRTGRSSWLCRLPSLLPEP